MTFISSAKLAEPLTDKADARLLSITRRWYSRNAREILPGLLLNSIVAGAAFAVRLLPVPGL
jgi:hypothetical protein